MTLVVILLLAAMLFGVLVGATVFWLIWQRRQSIRPAPAPKAPSPAARLSLRFHWKYIALPVIFPVLSLIMTAIFYGRLPAQTAYNFTAGASDKYIGRGAIIAWLLLPQFIFTALAILIVWGAITISARFRQSGSGLINATLAMMGNMVALPQAILAFAMLDIFSYNAYQVHLVPLWAFALLVMVLGAVGLGVFFVRALQRARTTQS